MADILCKNKKETVNKNTKHEKKKYYKMKKFKNKSEACYKYGINHFKNDPIVAQQKKRNLLIGHFNKLIAKQNYLQIQKSREKNIHKKHRRTIILMKSMKQTVISMLLCSR